MKKIILAFIIPFMIVSCKTGNEPQTPDEIRNTINEYKTEIKKLNKKIAQLEKQLEIMEKGESFVNAVKVNTMTVHPTVFRHYFMATGSLEAIDEAYVSPQTSGQIEKMAVEEGDRVKKGDLLAKLDTDIIENNIKEVETALELAKITYEKQKELWSKKIGSEIQYLQAKNKYETLKTKLETLHSQYDLAFIKAPIDGYVDEVAQKIGEVATPGRVMFHIVNLNNLLVKAKVSEVYLPVIKEGDKIKISFPSLPDYTVDNTISRVGQVINPGDRTFFVESKIRNQNNLLKPNMLASLLINDYQSNNALTVPSYLIREDLNGSYLYVVQTENGKAKAVKRYIKTGMSYQGTTEVLEGLHAGDSIITDGYNNVSDGQMIIINQ